LWAVLMLGTAGLIVWISKRFEPHWVSRDGRVFTCRIQRIDLPGNRSGPQSTPYMPRGLFGGGAGQRMPISERVNPSGWREARAAIVEGGVELRRRRSMRPEPRRMVLSRAPQAPKGRAIYLLDGDGYLSLRVPARSRAVAHLDELCQQ
jgi:hypothetical protein